MEKHLWSGPTKTPSRRTLPIVKPSCLKNHINSKIQHWQTLFWKEIYAELLTYFCRSGALWAPSLYQTKVNDLDDLKRRLDVWLAYSKPYRRRQWRNSAPVFEPEDTDDWEERMFEVSTSARGGHFEHSLFSVVWLSHHSNFANLTWRFNSRLMFAPELANDWNMLVWFHGVLQQCLDWRCVGNLGYTLIIL